MCALLKVILSFRVSMSDVTYELNEFIICKSSLRNEPFGYPAKIIEIKVVNEEKWYLVHYAVSIVFFVEIVCVFCTSNYVD